jgi:hypothetical protein
MPVKGLDQNLQNVMLKPLKKSIPGPVSSMSFFSLGWRAGMQPREDCKIGDSNSGLPYSKLMRYYLYYLSHAAPLSLGFHDK